MPTVCMSVKPKKFQKKMTEKSEPCPQLRAGSLGEEGRWQDEGQGAAGESAGSPHGHSSTGMAKPGLKWAWHLPVKALCPAAHGPGYLPRGPWALGLHP